MKKYHPVIAIIIGILVSGFIGYFLIALSDIIAIFIFILGGFIATYLSTTNKAIFGLYEGLVFSLQSLIPSIFIFKTELTLYLVIIWGFIPILGLFGGYIAKILRSRLNDEI